MEKLINLLHTGGYSCTIANGGKIRTFTQRGVADLYDLLTQEPEFLKGALIADKVVGKGAAALMILGGIKELQIYGYYQYQGFGAIPEIRCESRFCAGSCFYLEPRPYRRMSSRNHV